MPNAQYSLRQPNALSEKNQWTLWDDFDHYVTADTWTTTASDSGTVAVSDSSAGVVVLSPSDGTVIANDETYLKSTTEVFKVGSGAHLYGECRMKVVEAATNIAAAFFGFQNAIAANSIVDGGLVLRTTGDCFAIYKTNGALTWKAISSVNGTQTISTAVNVLVSNTYYNLRIEVRAVDGTNVESTFFVDDQPLRDSNGKSIKHLTAFASSTEMNVGVGIKNGANTTHDKVHVDYICATQTPRPSA